MATGGPIESVTLKGRRFPVDAEASCELVLQGFTNEVKPNGDGTNRMVKSRRAASAKGLVLQVDNDRGDQEYIQDLSNNLDFFDADITLCDGYIYSGNVQIVGDFSYNAKEATCEVEIQGTLAQQ